MWPCRLVIFFQINSKPIKSTFFSHASAIIATICGFSLVAFSTAVWEIVNPVRPYQCAARGAECCTTFLGTIRVVATDRCVDGANLNKVLPNLHYKKPTKNLNLCSFGITVCGIIFAILAAPFIFFSFGIFSQRCLSRFRATFSIPACSAVFLCVLEK